jgi:hypothetical protein
MGDLIGVGEHADPYANHGVGTFMYMTGSFMGQMLVNIPAPWSMWVGMKFEHPIFLGGE